METPRLSPARMSGRMRAAYGHTTIGPGPKAHDKDITMSDYHVHPIVRRIARDINADDVNAVSETQHEIVFTDTEDFDIPIFRIGDYHDGLNVHSVQNKRYTDGIVVSVFMKECAVVDVWESTGTLGSRGVKKYSWRGERARKRTSA